MDGFNRWVVGDTAPWAKELSAVGCVHAPEDGHPSAWRVPATKGGIDAALAIVLEAAKGHRSGPLDMVSDR